MTLVSPRELWNRRKTDKQVLAETRRDLAFARKVISLADLESFYDDLWHTENPPPVPVNPYDVIIQNHVQRNLPRHMRATLGFWRYLLWKVSHRYLPEGAL